MDTLTSYAGHDLTWEPSQTAKRTYELRAVDGQILATLTQPSAWRQNRLGEAAGRRWSFARVGVFRQRLVFADADSGAEIATMTQSAWSGKGALALPDGCAYQWRGDGGWGAKRVWLDASGTPLLRLKQFGMAKLRCQVSVEPPATDANLLFLATLGWYLMLLAHDDAIAVTAATTVVSAG
ncbi:MAG TPA: hypothetical protein VE338_19870 [Ktedonobacterales bacterium]|jgi:hypothetical protein|nr:hypothetical protein [Ktedonobacterales bacterium]